MVVKTLKITIVDNNLELLKLNIANDIKKNLEMRKDGHPGTNMGTEE